MKDATHKKTRVFENHTLSLESKCNNCLYCQYRYTYIDQRIVNHSEIIKFRLNIAEHNYQKTIYFSYYNKRK